MKALKEMIILALLAPLAPLFFVLGLFEVKWAVKLMNINANLSYVPAREELNLLEAVILREKAKIRAARTSVEGAVGSGINPGTGLPMRAGSTTDSAGFVYGNSPLND